MRNFRQLKIWQKGIRIATNAYKIVRSFPPTEKWGLAIQITRAGVSIPSNIAEGSSRSSDKDYNRFIEISLGSAYELETQLFLSQVMKMEPATLIQETLNLLAEEQKMLLAFSNQLQKKKSGS